MCILSGFFGGYLSRLCYTGYYLGGALDDSSVSDRVYAQRMSETLLSKFTIFDAKQELENTLIQECMALPGINNLAKYENHYLFYRNGLHFNTAFDYHQPDMFYWSPLQSEALLKLKVMTFPLGFGSRLELNLLYELNPEFASVEFELKQYNELRRTLDERYHRLSRLCGL